MLKIIYIKDFKAGQPFVVVTGSKEGFLRAADFLSRQQGCLLNDPAITGYCDIRELNEASLYLTAGECKDIAQHFENVVADDRPRHAYFESAALPNAEMLISYKEMASG